MKHYYVVMSPKINFEKTKVNFAFSIGFKFLMATPICIFINYTENDLSNFYFVQRTNHNIFVKKKYVLDRFGYSHHICGRRGT